MTVQRFFPREMTHRRNGTEAPGELQFYGWSVYNWGNELSRTNIERQGGNVPISREQFEQGSDGTDEQIMRLLSANPNKAFSVNEIAGVIYGDPPADVMDIILRIPRLLIGVGSALDSLVGQGNSREEWWTTLPITA